MTRDELNRMVKMEEVLNSWEEFNDTIEYYTDGDLFEAGAWWNCDWWLNEECDKITFFATGSRKDGSKKEAIITVTPPKRIQLMLKEAEKNDKR